MNSIENSIMCIFRAAHNKGLRLRRLKPSDEKHAVERYAERELICSACQTLDINGVAYSIQNEALFYYNNADDQKTWESFCKMSYSQEAKKMAARSIPKAG